jgi:hypothetical protein
LAPLRGVGGGRRHAEVGGGARPSWPRDVDGADGPTGSSGSIGLWVGTRGKREGEQRAGPVREKQAEFRKEKKKN